MIGGRVRGADGIMGGGAIVEKQDGGGGGWKDDMW